jgi:hypothetical protein
MAEMEARLAAFGTGWPDPVSAQVFTVHDSGPLEREELVERGASEGGRACHGCRPPVEHLEFEMDVRGAATKPLIWGRLLEGGWAEGSGRRCGMRSMFGGVSCLAGEWSSAHGSDWLVVAVWAATLPATEAALFISRAGGSCLCNRPGEDFSGTISRG